MLGEKRGAEPPPTNARILQRKSISTKPTPPLSKSLRNCTGREHQCKGKESQVINWLWTTQVLSHIGTLEGEFDAYCLSRSQQVRFTLMISNNTRQSGMFTVSLKGSQLYTLNPQLMPQEKHVLSWLKPMCNSSKPSFLLSDGLAIFLQHPEHPGPSQQDHSQDVWGQNMLETLKARREAQCHAPDSSVSSHMNARNKQ